MSGDTVYESGTEITAPWLTEVLRASDAIRTDERVAAIDSERIGTGQMGICDRFRVDIEDQGGGGRQLSIVGKFASDQDEVRAMMGPTGYSAEIEFYLDLAPALGGNLARCHYAAIDPASFGFTLLLDDLAPAVAGDQLVALSLDDANAGIDELASLHAPRWDDPALEHERCLSHATLGGGMLQQVYQMALPGFLDRFAPTLGPDRAEVYELLATGTDAWWEARPQRNTIVHGDFRADNLMFLRTDDSVTISPVDFQGVRRGPGAIDVAFFVGTSLPTDVRRAEESGLLRRWHDALLTGGVTDYSWSECTDDYRWSTVGALTTTVIGAAFSQVTERGEEMFRIMTSRQADQVRDWSGDRLLRTE